MESTKLPVKKKVYQRRGVWVLFGFLLLILILLNHNAPAVSPSTNTPPPAVADPSLNLPQLKGSIVYKVGPPEENNVIITNDQGNVGIIEVTNKDTFTWKNCFVGNFAHGSASEKVVVDMSRQTGHGLQENNVGDVAKGEKITIMAPTLNMTEDNFRLLSSLAVTCDNGQAQIGGSVGDTNTIANEFQKIQPLKVKIND